MEEKDKIKDSKLIGMRDFSRLLGVDCKTITKAIDKGRIFPTMHEGKRMYDPIQCKKDWYINTKITCDNSELMRKLEDEFGEELGVKHLMDAKNNDTILKKEASEVKLEEASEASEASEEKKPDPAYPGLPQYSDSKQKGAHFEAKQKELDYLQKAGELVSRREIEERAFSVGRRIRDKIMNLPNRLAPELAGERDIHRIELYLKKELNKCLTELSDVHDPADI